jgi:hypothetical protein
MKTARTLALFIGTIAIISFISCKKTDLANTETTTEEVGQTRIVLVSGTGSTLIENPDCSTTCINADGPYVEFSGYKTQTWGNPSNPQHWKKVEHVAYNTSTSFIVSITFTHSGGNTSNTISVTAFGSTQSVATLASGSTHTFTFDLPAGWNACDNVPFSIHQEGQNSPMNLSCSYTLYGVCINTNRCETTFTGEAITCGNQREAVYTLTAKEAIDNFKIQGGLTNFTGEDAIVEITGGTGITTSQWTTGGSSNRVIKVEGSIAECGVITIRIKWNSTNSGGIITGSWSISANGSEVAPAVEGLECH